MDKAERDVLIMKRVELVEELNTRDGLFTQLISRKVLSPRMARTLQNGKTTDQQTEALLDLLPTRGPDAFAQFCESLEADFQGHIVGSYLKTLTTRPLGCDLTQGVSPISDSNVTGTAWLSPSRSREIGSIDAPVAVATTLNRSAGDGDSGSCGSNIILIKKQRLDDNNDGPHTAMGDDSRSTKGGDSDDEGIDLTDGDVLVKVQPCCPDFYSQKWCNAYKMSSSPRGQAVIMNVDDVVGKGRRRGTNIDRDNMTDLLHQLNFVVTTYNDLDDLTATGMLNKLLAFAASPHHQGADCCVIVILSHGERDRIYGTDGKTIPVDSILLAFDNTHCPALMGKPKIVFLQACRGGALDSGVDAYDEPDSGDPMSRLPSLSDMVVCYPTQQGYYAWRNRERGSWYVEAVVQVFMKYACNEDLCALLNRVNATVSRKVSRSPDLRLHNMTQMSEFKSSLCRPYFYFFPGLSPEQMNSASSHVT